MSKFIIHESMEIFTTHGCMTMAELYDGYIANGNKFDSNLAVAGVKQGWEYRFGIKYIQEIWLNECYTVHMSGDKFVNGEMFVHPEQKFWLADGSEKRVCDIDKPFTMIVAKNGCLYADSAGLTTTKQRFFIIDTTLELRNQKVIPSIIAGNLILLPIEEEEVNNSNPFFISEEE